MNAEQIQAFKVFAIAIIAIGYITLIYWEIQELELIKERGVF